MQVERLKKKKDGETVGNKLRLYCLRLSNKILVFGNGGVKDTRSWQESETLAQYVKLLVDTSRFISSRIKSMDNV